MQPRLPPTRLATMPTGAASPPDGPPARGGRPPPGGTPPAADDALSGLAATFEMLPVPTALLGPDWAIVQVNRACCRLWGHPAPALLGSSVLDLVEHQDVPAVRRMLDGVARTGMSTRRETRWRDGTGAALTTYMSITAAGAADGAGGARYLTQYEDVTAPRAVEAELRELADRDALTEVYNRRGLWAAIERQVAHATRHGAEGALLLVDLDDFKRVNDTDGHAAGDRLLVAVAERLRLVLRLDDQVGRLGGDEFGVLLTSGGADETRAVAQKLAVAVRDVGITAAVGAVLISPGQSAEALLEEADAAMYRAKRLGPGSHVVADA